MQYSFTMVKTFVSEGDYIEHRNLKLSQVKKEVTTIDGKKVACYIYIMSVVQRIIKVGSHHLT